MKTRECGRYSEEGGKLPGYHTRAWVGIGMLATGQRIWIDGLPSQRSKVGPILRHQIMKESGSATRQAEQEDRSSDLFINDPRVVFFFRTKPQQIGQIPHHIPTNRDTAKCGQASLCLVCSEQHFEWFPERPFTEVSQAGALLRKGNQVFGQ